MFLFFSLIGIVLSVDESIFNTLRIYQVMVSSFQDGDPNVGFGDGYGPSDHKGDLQGIINALDYIKDLGFNALWMTPIFDSTNGDGGIKLQSTGYFATNYFKIDPRFGDEETFKKLVDTAHEKGIYVILDGVLGHHGGVTTPSPNGNLPQGGSNPVDYPGSLPYYKEVVQYWIKNFGIDGWRLDQSYQLYQNDHNYLKEIREAVYEACDQRKAAGEKWGILGYIVAEDWESVNEINLHTFGGDGLRSAFDFPYRHTAVKAIAQEESGAGGYPVETLGDVFRSTEDRGYSSGSQPNFFITNHDLYRFGNLIREKYSYSTDNEAYWKRYKMAIGLLGSYSGPITLYYGDEIGDITECWYSNHNQCPGTTAGDNCARTNGKIKDFNENQQDMHDFTAKLMKIRTENPAMYKGTYSNTFNGGVLICCKYDPETSNKIVHALNLGLEESTVTYMVGGVQLTDLLTGEVNKGAGGVYSITLEALETKIFRVDETVPEPEPSSSLEPEPEPESESSPDEIQDSSEEEIEPIKSSSEIEESSEDSEIIVTPSSDESEPTSSQESNPSSIESESEVDSSISNEDVNKQDSTKPSISEAAIAGISVGIIIVVSVAVALLVVFLKKKFVTETSNVDNSNLIKDDLV